jgi:hypothetical protein
MWTAKELRFQADVCLELAKSSKEYFVRVALTELSRELYQNARRTERRSATGLLIHTRKRNLKADSGS